MPKIADNATRDNFKFKGHTVAIPRHFPVGHQLSENDARFANRQLASTLGNVLASAITRKVAAMQKANDEAFASTDAAVKAKARVGEDGKPVQFSEKDIPTADVQAMFDEIYTNYEIGVSNRGDGSGGVAHDPVESIANNIAWEQLKVILKENGYKVASVTGENKARLIKEQREANPGILEAAKAQFSGAKPTIKPDMFKGLTKADAPATPTQPSTDAGPTGENTTMGDPTTSNPAGTTDPSSTAETNGTTAADAGTTPSNPGTVGTTEEGTGQGTPSDAVQPTDTGERVENAATTADDTAAAETPAEQPAPSGGAFA